MHQRQIRLLIFNINKFCNNGTFPNLESENSCFGIHLSQEQLFQHLNSFPPTFLANCDRTNQRQLHRNLLWTSARLIQESPFHIIPNILYAAEAIFIVQFLPLNTNFSSKIGFSWKWKRFKNSPGPIIIIFKYREHFVWLFLIKIIRYIRLESCQCRWRSFGKRRISIERYISYERIIGADAIRLLKVDNQIVDPFSI